MCGRQHHTTSKGRKSEPAALECGGMTPLSRAANPASGTHSKAPLAQAGHENSVLVIKLITDLILNFFSGSSLNEPFLERLIAAR